MIEILYENKSSVKKNIQTFLKQQNLDETGAEKLRTFELINNILPSATYPYTFINQDKQILQRYDGICFIFDNPSGNSNVKSAYINKCSLSKIAIYPCDSLELTIKTIVIPYPILDVIISKGIDIFMSAASMPKSIRFGDEMDYVLSLLKNPQKVYPLPMADTPGKGIFYRWNKATDLVLNYFSYGFDIVINGDTHRVKKFILHTNMPAHPLFHFYDRCLFSIQNSDALIIKKPEILKEEAKEKKAYTVNDKLFGNEFINTCSSLMQIKKILKEENWQDEVTYMRSWTKHNVKTMYYAREGAIFEISESGFLCSLTLFDPQNDM